MKVLRILVLWVLLLVVLDVSAWGDSSAMAASPGVVWSLQSLAQPTSFQSSDVRDRYILSIVNVGTRASGGSLTLTDTLPVGVTTSSTPRGQEGWSCSEGAGQSVVMCTNEGSVAALTPAGTIEVPVSVAPDPLEVLSNDVVVSGGVAGCGQASQAACPTASTASTTTTGVSLAPFAPLDFSSSVLEGAGADDTRAGAHPSSLTTDFAIPTALRETEEGIILTPVEDLKQLVVDLPAGLIGGALAAPTCSLAAVTNLGPGDPNASPPATRIGTLELIKGQGAQSGLSIFNMAPEHGYPAEFAVYEPTLQRAVVLYGSVRSGPDYGLRVTLGPQDRLLASANMGSLATFFGDPAATDNSGQTQVAFFTNPSDCTASGFTTRIHADSWQNPGRFNADGTPDFTDPNWKEATSVSPPVTGCEDQQFHPTVSVRPDTSAPDSPTGIGVDIHVPQNSDPQGLATPPVKNITVALPLGLAVSPSSADGLEGCSDEQFALTSLTPAACPLASQLATVAVHTPVLANALEGQLFLGAPKCAPCTVAAGDPQSGRMLRLFLQVHSEEYGVTLKLPGMVEVNPSTGQLTALLNSNPQFPFSDVNVQLKNGPRAALATPSACGTYTTTTDLTSWGAPYIPDATPFSAFGITGCGSVSVFAPSFTAGMVNPQAGGFSPFTMTFSRQDSDQQLSGLSVTLPPGLLAHLAGVPLCPDASANAGTCPAASQIGSVTAGAGPGSHPLFLGGQVYLTGPFNGGPFGFVVEVPASAGPFDLGTVVVRQSLHVDPYTAQATVVSDPFPSMLDGIPLQLRTVNATIDRPGFTFNPTDCKALAVSGTLTSTQGMSAGVSSHFQAANCASLPFKPVFTVSTQAKSSKKDGASLVVKGSFRAGDANLHSVGVVLPRQLPARLTTIQQACTQAVFDVNPAGCPAGSVIGVAAASTPVLVGALRGPAYLVSHGGAAFPDLVMILQGEGITLDVTGNIDIKHGVTSSTFASIPDAPITSFTLTLPEGPHSGLAAVVPAKAKGSLCGQSLSMPFTITGQNGAQVKQPVKIAVTGCPRARKGKKRPVKHSKKHGKKG
jgi:hypothetical protein